MFGGFQEYGNMTSIDLKSGLSLTGYSQNIFVIIKEITVQNPIEQWK